jgi:hypothetical protein
MQDVGKKAINVTIDTFSFLRQGGLRLRDALAAQSFVLLQL